VSAITKGINRNNFI